VRGFQAAPELVLVRRDQGDVVAATRERVGHLSAVVQQTAPTAELGERYAERFDQMRQWRRRIALT
jgi:hypothetical protein